MIKISDVKVDKLFDNILISMFIFYPEIEKYIWRFVAILTSVVNARFSRETISMAVWFILLIVFFRQFGERIKVKDVLKYVGICIVMILFYLFPSHNEFTMERLFSFIFTVLPAYFCGKIYMYDEDQKKFIYKAAAIITVLSIVYNYMFMAPRQMLGENNMNTSYNILPSILILLAAAFENKRYRVLSVAGIFYMITLGTRGALLCIGIFLLLMLIKTVRKRKIIAFACVATVVFSYLVSSGIFLKGIVLLSEQIERMGLSTRILSLIEEEEITNSTGREDISGMVIENILEDPVKVRGPYWDRKVIKGTTFSGIQFLSDSQTYTHNFFLEILCQYGIILGGIICVYVLYKMIRVLIKTDKNKYYIPAIFICCGFVVLMVSNSYLLSSKFFFLMGLCLNTTFLKSTEDNKYENL